ncbi:hypothetical protein B0A48_11514 [Cryoendolithus antarcticus]|uniref:C2H2-type domain-containing protein n=1 Tax=Cryoendolithus antarcticus TaxID=1507870 RepID=A0A1V8SW91_9PEZI|nr:hypothetical protein B0A48_11514 [Cryoendolithus antarcticus]
MEAAVESGVADGSIPTARRTSMSRAALATLNDAPPPIMPASLPFAATVPERLLSSGSAITDGPPLTAFAASDKTKPRRRASDGTHLTKKEKAATGNLKCETCGKAYKHGSCLNKHLWEHTPEWQVTSKLLISKHQQVQLLEAASVLVAMNTDGTAIIDSDNSSSPAASGSSDPHDDLSSTETTPPPQSEQVYRDTSHRYSNASSAYSRSYQSVFSSGSAPQEHPPTGFSSHNRHWSSSSNRPNTAATSTSIAESYNENDSEDLACAINLLRCHNGTPSGPAADFTDIPPVPPLPAKYQVAEFRSLAAHMQDSVRGDDVDMDEESEDDEHNERRQHYEAEEPMFGNMDA